MNEAAGAPERSSVRFLLTTAAMVHSSWLSRTLFGFFSVDTWGYGAATTPPTAALGEALRHGGAFTTGSRTRRTSWPSARIAIALALALSAGTLATASPCHAEDSTPSIFGYAMEGFGTGLAVGFATGYLATGPKWESGEWRTVLWGGGIGALTGLGIGLTLGIIDAGTTPNGRGVGFYIMRDSNYGYSVGALAGAVIGALVWAGDGTSKDVLIGLSWGTVIGAGAGVILGVIEGALRRPSSSEHSERRAIQIGLGFTPSETGAPMLPYPTLSGRF